MRDSTLRAISLTSSQNLLRWQPQLLHSVTLTHFSLESFCSFLVNQEVALLSCVKSLCYGWKGSNIKTPRQISARIAARSTLLSLPQETFSGDRKEVAFRHTISGFDFLNQCILASLPELEELIILDQFLLFSFHFNIPIPAPDGNTTISRSIPFPFLTQSLKKLYVKFAEHGSVSSFSGRNVVWLLLFCEKLNELTICFDISRKDMNYLSDFVETYKNRSKVKKLAICFRFICSQSGTSNPQWKAKGKDQESGLSRIEKLQSVTNLIHVTSGLEAFEMNTVPTLQEEEYQPDYRTALTSLSSSESTLRHLREFVSLIEFGSNLTSSFDLSRFKNLKILSVGRASLEFLERDKFTLNIETLQLLCYMDCGELPPTMEHECYPEDPIIARLLELQLLPQLKTVCIPKHLINSDNKKFEDKTGSWLKRRRELQSKESFTSGKIELRELEDSEYRESRRRKRRVNVHRIASEVDLFMLKSISLSSTASAVSVNRSLNGSASSPPSSRFILPLYQQLAMLRREVTFSLRLDGCLIRSSGRGRVETRWIP